MAASDYEEVGTPAFSFFKGADDVAASKNGKIFNWEQAAATVRESLSDALCARNVSFLLGSGCSSFLDDESQLGIPTMKPMAEEFINRIGDKDNEFFVTENERDTLLESLGLDIIENNYTSNLEHLMEVLYSFKFALKCSKNNGLAEVCETVEAVISKITRYVL
jgi:hypothetical protein